MHDIKLTLQTGFYQLFSQARVRPVACGGDRAVLPVFFPVIARTGLPALLLNILFCLEIYVSIASPISRAVGLAAGGFSTRLLAISQPQTGEKPLVTAITVTLQGRSSDPYFSWIRHEA